MLLTGVNARVPKGDAMLVCYYPCEGLCYYHPYAIILIIFPDSIILVNRFHINRVE
jgi:hypothetical protein